MAMSAKVKSGQSAEAPSKRIGIIPRLEMVRVAYRGCTAGMQDLCLTQ